MLRRSLVATRHAFDAVRCSVVDAIRAAWRTGGAFYVDSSCQEPLVLVRSKDREPHFRRYPRHPRPTVARSKPKSSTPHQRAIRRLHLELSCGEGLRCLFHDGTRVGDEALMIFDRVQKLAVAVEFGFRLGRTRFVPDLLVACAHTGAPLLAIEVRASNAVGVEKRSAYQQAGLRWIEVSALHTIRRFRHAPLCVENWGGNDFPCSPMQRALHLRVITRPRQIGTPASRLPPPRWTSVAPCRSSA
jgi:hypothetical protein